MATVSPTLQNVMLCKSSMNTGYVSGDIKTEIDQEPQDSGRTRSSARRAAAQSSSSQSQESRAPETPIKASPSKGGRGRKRKRGVGGDGSDSEPEDNEQKEPNVQVVDVSKHPKEPICSCPRDVMKCIGILPSLPLVGCFNDSSDSECSTLEDLTHTLLPSVRRERRGQSDE